MSTWVLILCPELEIAPFIVPELLSDLWGDAALRPWAPLIIMIAGPYKHYLGNNTIPTHR
jgi:hypothetical protein